MCIYIYIYLFNLFIIEGSLEFRQYGEMKKQSAGRRVRREKIRRKKMQVREKVGKSRNTVFFRGFVAPEGWKVGSLKRRARRHLGRWEMKKCTPLWREAHLEVKCVKNWGVRSSFGSWDDEKAHGVVARSTFPSQNVQNTPGSDQKVHAVVARSTFRSQNVQNAPGSDHFWKLRCRKSARRCGAKYISKSKCTKHHMFAPLLEVQISKMCTPLWREAHFEVKIHQGFGPLLEVQMSLRVIALHYTLHYSTLHYTTLHNTTTTELHNYTPLHSTTLNYNTLRHITLHYTTLHYTIHSTTLHYTTLYTPHTTVHYTPRHYNYRTTQLHSTTLHYTPLH